MKIIKDSKEQRGWEFPNMVVANLKTGDYSLEGLDNIFCLERKGTLGEFASNITDPRFERELTRMDTFSHSFLLLEFSLEDVYKFPYDSGIPANVWSKLRVGSKFILKRLIEIQTQHKCQVVFAGTRGKEFAELIFKRINNLYGKN